MEHKTLKDLRWFLVKDCELYNKPKSICPGQFGRDDCDYDPVAFDVETSDGLYTFLQTKQGLFIYPENKSKKAYAYFGRHIKHLDKLRIPLDLDEPLFPNGQRYIYDPDVKEIKTTSFRQLGVILDVNDF